jgi:beta-glucanase (GH16 family)
MNKFEEDSNNDQNEIRRRTILLIAAIGSASIIGVATLNNITTSPDKKRNTPEQRGEFTDAPTWRQNFAQQRELRLDTKIWHYDTDYRVPSYNDEEQAYTDMRKNIYIDPGVGLIIQAQKDNYIYPADPQSRQYKYTSGRIDTRNTFTFEYGKVEARMRLPEGEGTWPAFWLLSENKIHTTDTSPSQDDERFYTKDGEIDIMEHYGHDPGVIEATVHTYKQSNVGTITIPDATSEFHSYGVEVTPDSITWTIDDTPYHTFTRSSDDPNEWPFGNGNKLYIILNLAMGGTGGGDIADGHSPWKFAIEDISYYDYLPK